MPRGIPNKPKTRKSKKEEEKGRKRFALNEEHQQFRDYMINILQSNRPQAVRIASFHQYQHNDFDNRPIQPANGSTINERWKSFKKWTRDAQKSVADRVQADASENPKKRKPEAPDYDPATLNTIVHAPKVDTVGIERELAKIGEAVLMFACAFDSLSKVLIEDISEARKSRQEATKIIMKPVVDSAVDKVVEKASRNGKGK